MADNNRAGFDSRIGWQHIVSIALAFGGGVVAHEVYQWNTINAQTQALAEQRAEIRVLQSGVQRSRDDVVEIKQSLRDVSIKLDQLREFLERKR